MDLTWETWFQFFLALLIAVVALAALGLALLIGYRLLHRRHPVAAERFRALVKPLLGAAAVSLLILAVIAKWPHPGSKSLVLHILIVAVIAALAWLATSAVTVAVRTIRERHPIQDESDQEARRLQTQVSVIHGLVTAAIWLVAAGIALFTIPGAEAVGTSLLASAGLASVVAGIAAQSFLGNLFAGLQIAFSGTLKVNDLVDAQGQQGRVEDIRLTSIVLKTWDGRRLVLPSSYFTQNPFENWSGGGAELLGTIPFDVDWRVSPAEMEQELKRVLTELPLWDGRQAYVTVADATGGMVRVQAVVSAAIPGDLMTLRSQVRARLVEWLATEQRQLPVTRVLEER